MVTFVTWCSAYKSLKYLSFSLLKNKSFLLIGFIVVDDNAYFLIADNIFWDLLLRFFVKFIEIDNNPPWIVI